MCEFFDHRQSEVETIPLRDYVQCLGWKEDRGCLLNLPAAWLFYILSEQFR